jgi:hypothetical protein
LLSRALSQQVVSTSLKQIFPRKKLLLLISVTKRYATHYSPHITPGLRQVAVLPARAAA